MKIRSGRLSIFVVIALVVGIWVLSLPLDSHGAVLFKEVSKLNGPEVIACDGPTVGKGILIELTSGLVKAKVVFKSGPPNATLNVFWTGQNVAYGCHSNAVGYVELGTITTDAFGVGKKVFKLPGGNPFPGYTAHYDVCVPFCSAPIYTATFSYAPSVGGAANGVSAGDPTQ
jgi:hypothetical protein